MNQLILKIMPSKLKRILGDAYRPIKVRINPHAGLNGLDLKVLPYLPSKGFYVEAGANDGIKQSNTLFLERIHGWTGILVEPVPRLFNKCVKNRPNSNVLNYALVAPEHSGEIIELVDVDLMTSIRQHDGFTADEDALLKAEKIQGIKRKLTFAPGETITRLLQSSNVSTVDFLSLDVEGFELHVLKGLDLDYCAPGLILIETQKLDEVLIALSGRYTVLEKLWHHDYLLKFKG